MRSKSKPRAPNIVPARLQTGDREVLLTRAPESVSGPRRERTAVLVFVGDGPANDSVARRLAQSLDDVGVRVLYLGRQESARSIARAVVNARADALELCLGRTRGVRLLRELLRELRHLDRRDVSIVIHKIN